MTDFTPRNFMQIERHDIALKVLCAVFGLLSIIVLTACGDGKPTKDFYVRVTVEATYNGNPQGPPGESKTTIARLAPIIRLWTFI